MQIARVLLLALAALALLAVARAQDFGDLSVAEPLAAQEPGDVSLAQLSSHVAVEGESKEEGAVGEGGREEWA